MAIYKKIGIELLEDDLIFKIKNSAQINEITIDMLAPALRSYIESKKVDDSFDSTPIYTAINELKQNKVDADLLEEYFKKDTDKITGTMIDDSVLEAIAQDALNKVSTKFNSTYRQVKDPITMSDLGSDVTSQFDTIKQSVSSLSSKMVTSADLEDLNTKIDGYDSAISDISVTASNASTLAQSAIDAQTPINNSLTALSEKLTNLENTAMIKDTTVLLESQLPASTKEQLQTMANQIAALQNPSGSAETDKAVSASWSSVATNDLQMEEIKADSDVENFYYIDTENNTVLYYTKTLIGSDDTSEEENYTWNSETLLSTGLGFILDKKYGRIFYNTHLVGGYPYVLNFDITLAANESKTVETTQWFTDCLSNRPLTYIKPDIDKEEYIPATLYITTLISANGFTVTNNTEEIVAIKVIVKGVCR